MFFIFCPKKPGIGSGTGLLLFKDFVWDGLFILLSVLWLIFSVLLLLFYVIFVLCRIL